MILKTLTAGILATSLTLTSLTPTTATAEISQEDAIAGIISLLIIGAAIHNNRSDDDDRADRDRGGDRRVLPARCLRQDTRRNGNHIRYFGQRCLSRNYQYVNRLPARCHVQFRTINHERRQGFRARCLRNEGFRTSRH